MAQRSGNQRASSGLLACMLLGTAVVLAGGGWERLWGALETGPVEFLLRGLLVLMACLVAGAALFIPYGFVALGWLRIGDYRRQELDALPDDNTVGDPEEGERKYQEWLSAMNSSEAFLGMVPRSAPYVPPEQRAPEGSRLPSMRFNRVGMACIALATAAGALFAVYVASQYGAGEGSAKALARNIGVMQLLASGLLGAVFGVPFGIVLALVFGRVEVGEEGEVDDAGGSGTETA